MEEVLTSTEVSKQHFDDIAKDYDNSSDGKFVAPMYEEVVRRITAYDPKRVLDLGCGNGNVLKQLSKKNKDRELYGLDLSEQMIKEAKKNVPGAAFCVGSSEKLPYSDHSFDLIVCNASFHHYTKPEVVLKEVSRVLAPHGVFILGDPTIPVSLFRNITNYFLKYSNSGDFKLYGKKEITKLLGEHGFRVENYKMMGMKQFVLDAKKQ